MPSSHLSLRRLYNFYNRKFFNSALPSDIELIWSPCDDANGKTDWIDGHWRIRIDPALQAQPRFTRIVMLHEMIHVAKPKANHGRVFKSERQRLWDAGAFDRLI